MTEEELAKKKKYAGEKKPSMKRRANGHDYTERRFYMITLETEGRLPLFGHLAGNPFAEAGSSDAPHIVLSELGKAVQDEWFSIPAFYPQIDVIALQMMPDHMHGILFVKAPIPVHLGQVITGFKAGCRKAQRRLDAQAAPAAPTMTDAAATDAAKPRPTEKPALAQQSGALPPSPQEAVSPLPSQPSPLPSQAPPLPKSAPSIRPIFARGYNDLILRTYDELTVWKNYLLDNPRRLLMKHARPDWLYPFFGLKLGPFTFNGIGNRSLLTAPRRIAVKLSRRLTDQQIEEATARYLAEASQGAVLVSPAISPGEKRVMRAAFDAGLPTIVLLENGFTQLSKPHGEQFNACSTGRLLMLSPWEHHNEKHSITRIQCEQLNQMALAIAQSTKL
jgi:hypothetical protein